MSRQATSSRPLLSLGRALLAALVASTLGTLVAGCAGNQAAFTDVRYDLGPLEAQAAPAASASPALPPLKVLEVSAPPPLDNDGILYRISGDAQRESRYANSRWAMSPARLLTQRLRSSLASRATVLSGADAVPAPMLKVELNEFEQVFDSATSSSGVLAARATLMQGGKVIAQRSFIARAPASSPDAAGGAAALRAASDDFAGQIGTWLSGQALAGTP
ncbi:MAG TPA: ABC-type transport auxiliary lipoprotein family protein [Paraburkholderia sp.]|jgi:cholesterol transport system auxiliary component|uniref:ABC-type transport auxiliary lipoprotein family protein n=1 Tax=Paraburkholderia sp. TaxID=1926495 RepID=UPI002DF248DA|nr:ABC-type transport auxiliary lipoprotein family protein [Paraburkholderia sp.]